MTISNSGSEIITKQLAAHTTAATLAQVIPHLFISDLPSSQSTTLLSLHEITHIISLGLDLHPAASTFPNGDSTFQYHVITVEDVDTADMIIHLPTTYDIIEDAIHNGGNVLVHCHAGVSRSATIVTAYLMKIHDISMDEALRQLQGVYPRASPNPGFISQLSLYQQMSCTISNDNTDYRRYTLSRMACEFSNYGSVSSYTLSANPTPSSLLASLSEKSFRCKKCRTPLASTSHVITHTPGPGQVNFAYFKRDLKVLMNVSSLYKNTAPRCNTLFVEPMQWAAGMIDAGDVDGKLHCPNSKCGAKLGTYNWAGLTCSCGTWVTPAFALQKAKID